jgi:tetratricopeptide (TPR) repeat protein
LELALRLEAIGAMMALGHIDEIFNNMECAEAIAAQLNDQRARASVSTQTAVFLWMRGQFEQGLWHASRGLDAARLAQRRHMMMAARQTRLMHFHALGRYSEAAAEGRVLLADYGPELAQHVVQPGWAAIPIINLYSFHASTLWRLGDYEAGQEVCALAYEILSNVDHPYSRLLIDIVQAQIWIEKEELDKAEALMRKAMQQCLAYNVPTMLAVCTGTLGSALARNGKASEAAPLLEKGFADHICDAAGPYGRIFMRVGLGVAYRNLGRLEDAIRVGRKAVEQAGEEYGHRTEALCELAQTLRHAGDAPGAEDCFMQAYEAARHLGMPYYQKRAGAALAKQHEDRHQA